MTLLLPTTLMKGRLTAVQKAAVTPAFEKREKLSKEAFQKQFDEYRKNNPMPINPYPDLEISSSALRYPSSPAISPDSDYVAFKFYKYQPPWGRNMHNGDKDQTAKPMTQVYFNEKTAGGTIGGRKMANAEKAWDKHTEKGRSVLNYYNRADQYVPTEDETILLYMPDDISTGYKANWGGKSVGAAGRAELVALAQNGMGWKAVAQANRMGQQWDRWAAKIGTDAIKDSVKKVGGDVMSDDDILGGVSGVVQNPNAEMLFQNTEMRTFQLKYKLVPRNPTEAITIKAITNLFKRNMLPGTQVSQVFQWSRGDGVTAGFISVPDLVRVSFMKGSDENTDLPQFKMCAMTQVDVNYTPDGQYATYEDGTPVATELTLNFQETKLIYKEEADRY